MFRFPVDPMNLPTETDPFESPEDEKSRETPSPIFSSEKTNIENKNTATDKQPTTTNSKQSWMDEETPLFQAPAFLQDLKLPTVDYSNLDR